MKINRKAHDYNSWPEVDLKAHIDEGLAETFMELMYDCGVGNVVILKNPNY